MADLCFGSCIRYNIVAALRHMETFYAHQLDPIGLEIIEWGILLQLYEEDGQMPSRLADAVGYKATSFTQVLSRLQCKGFIERRAHPASQRAIRVYLTCQGRSVENQVRVIENVEQRIRQEIEDADWEAFQRVIEVFQLMTP